MSLETAPGSARNPCNGRLLIVLIAPVLISMILITPYTLTLQAATLKTARLPLPPTILLPVQWAETTVLYGILAAIGVP
jgi:hypothetical protein